MTTDPLCVCGHARVDHMAGGTCLRGTPSGEASVCACLKYSAPIPTKRKPRAKRAAKARPVAVNGGCPF